MDGFSTFIYAFGDFRLDTGKRLLRDQSGNTIPLMPKAYETLKYLVEHAGQIVEKEELIAAVWPDTVVEENNLSQNISLLRKALGERPGDHRYIVTVPGRGFKFVGEVREEAAGVPDDRSGAPQQEQPSARQSMRLALIAIAAVVSIAGIALAFLYFHDNKQIDSIAVIPFVNESGDPELEYLSDGMTQTLIDNLTELRGLNVKPRSTVFRYKGKQLDATAIGKELGVGAVMFGWVTKRGEDLTLRVELVDVQTENNLWSQTYDRKVTNLVSLQGEIARSLVRGLSLKLSGAEEKKLGRKNTENAEAYQLYLNGQFHFRQLSPAAITRGIAFLQQAIAIDPSYALAYATLARSYVALALAGEADPGEFQKAKAAAQKAVELDPDLADGHAVSAVVLAFYDWKWDEAENHFKRALELDPNNAATHQGYGDLLGRIGRRHEAADQLNRAVELEPFSPFMNSFAAVMQTDDELALQRVRFAIDLDPNFYLARVMAAQIYRRKKMPQEAVGELAIAKTLAPALTMSDAMLASCLVELGRLDEARLIRDDLLRISSTRFVPPVNIASVHDALGETDLAVAMLEKGYQIRDPRMSFLKTHPYSKQLREHPKFQELFRHMGF